jgi:hypothetical protein
MAAIVTPNVDRAAEARARSTMAAIVTPNVDRAAEARARSTSPSRAGRRASPRSLLNASR